MVLQHLLWVATTPKRSFLPPSLENGRPRGPSSRGASRGRPRRPTLRPQPKHRHSRPPLSTFSSLPKPTPGAWRLSPRSPAPRRRVAVVVASCSSAAPRAPVLGAPPLPPSLSAQPLDLPSLPPGNTCGAPPRARFVYRHRQSFSFLSSSRWRKSRLGNSRVEPKTRQKFVMMIYIYKKKTKRKNQCGLPSPGRSQKQAQNRRMTRPCLSKKSAPLSTGAGFVPAVGP